MFDIPVAVVEVEVRKCSYGWAVEIQDNKIDERAVMLVVSTRDNAEEIAAAIRTAKNHRLKVGPQA